MQTSDRYKPRTLSPSTCRVPTFGCPPLGAYLCVATDRDWPGAQFRQPEANLRTALLSLKSADRMTAMGHIAALCGAFAGGPGNARRRGQHGRLDDHCGPTHPEMRWIRDTRTFCTPSAISVKRCPPSVECASRIRFAGLCPPLTPLSEPRCTMHRAELAQPACSPSINVNGSRGDDTKPCLR